MGKPPVEARGNSFFLIASEREREREREIMRDNER